MSEPSPLRRVAVTGAAGHLGGVVVRALLDVGAEVRALVHRDRRALEGLDVEVCEGDVTDRGAVARLVRGRDLVIHLAALVSLDPRDEAAMQAINVDAVRAVADACVTAGVRLVHTSSIHAFASDPVDATVDEARGPAEPTAPAYNRSKAAGAAVVREAVARGLDAVIVAPTAVVGPHDFRPSPMGEVLLDLHRGRFHALVEGGFDWVDVRDVAASLVAAGRKGARGETYLLSGAWCSLADLAKHVDAVTGERRPKLVAPMALARVAAPFAVAAARLRGTRPLFTPSSLVALRNHRRISSVRARRDLGHTPRPLEETLRDTFAWFEGRGMLARK